MLTLISVMLEINKEAILAADKSTLMMVISRQVVQRTLQDSVEFERMMKMVNERLIADHIIFLGWTKY